MHKFMMLKFVFYKFFNTFAKRVRTPHWVFLVGFICMRKAFAYRLQAKGRNAGAAESPHASTPARGGSKRFLY